MNPPLLSSGWRGRGTRPVRQLRSKNVGLRILNLLAVQKSLDEFFCTLMQMESGRIKGRFILEADLDRSKIMVGLLISALLRSSGSFIEHFTLANRPRQEMIGNLRPFHDLARRPPDNIRGCAEPS